MTIKGFCSTFVPVPSGVPQGSHLGPLLFNIFINDIREIFDHSSLLLFADDMKISKLSDCLQEDLNKLCKYCNENFLSLNVKKCSTISFTCKISPNNNQYNLKGEIMSRVSEVGDLGIYLDNKLIFKFHIDYIVAKAYQMLGFILRVGKEFKNYHSLDIGIWLINLEPTI